MTEKSQALQFWVNQAHESSDARALAETLGLILPRGQATGLRSGLKYPIRRLVVTGNDTTENFRILLGVDSVPDIHAETRREVLLMPIAEGSALSILNEFLDEGCPAVNPRPFTDDEDREFTREVAALDPRGTRNWGSGARVFKESRIRKGGMQ